MASSVAPSEVRVGDNVKVVVLDDTSIAYTGKVIGIASYPAAKSMGSDIAARHEQVKSAITATGGGTIADILDQKFLILDTGSTMPTVIAFDWIQDNEVELIEMGATYTIKLLNSSKEKAEEAVAILRANSISCKLNTTY